jgi:hypothetical protein
MKKTHQKNTDHEEKEILSSFEKGDWKTVRNVEKQKKQAQKIASKTISQITTRFHLK